MMLMFQLSCELDFRRLFVSRPGRDMQQCQLHVLQVQPVLGRPTADMDPGTKPN